MDSARERSATGMARLVCKLLTLFAVLIMPLGMTAAPTAAMQQHATSMPMRHCPEQAPKQTGHVGFTECTMACSAALPAGDLKQHELPLIDCAPLEAEAVPQLHGLHPDTATPPPKAS